MDSIDDDLLNGAVSCCINHVARSIRGLEYLIGLLGWYHYFWDLVPNHSRVDNHSSELSLDTFSCAKIDVGLRITSQL